MFTAFYTFLCNFIGFLYRDNQEYFNEYQKIFTYRIVVTSHFYKLSQTKSGHYEASESDSSYITTTLQTTMSTRHILDCRVEIRKVSILDSNPDHPSSG